MFGSEIGLQINSGQLSGYAAVFYNYFLNYIFLAPTSEEYVGLPIYRYLQQNAEMHGADASLTYNPKLITWLSLHETFSMVQGTRTDGLALPFIPPPRLTSEVRADFKLKGNPCFVKTSFTYVEAQNQVALFEKSTPSYNLLNFGLGFTRPNARSEWQFSLTCNNAMNIVYYDHLSRYKYFGVNNMGRNIVLNVSYKFLKQLKHEK
jgi:iron complex outermembrane receptor protein